MCDTLFDTETYVAPDNESESKEDDACTLASDMNPNKKSSSELIESEHSCLNILKAILSNSSTKIYTELSIKFITYKYGLPFVL